jgi:hypothetical protein
MFLGYGCYHCYRWFHDAQRSSNGFGVTTVHFENEIARWFSIFDDGSRQSSRFVLVLPRYIFSPCLY